MAAIAPTPPTPDKINALRAQVNRYMGPKAPAAYRLSELVLPTTGPIDMALAIHALTIFQRRAAEVYPIDKVAGQQMIEAANAGYANPVAFVTSNFDNVLRTVAVYGDLHGLPPGATTAPFMKGLTLPIMVGGGLLALWWITRK